MEKHLSISDIEPKVGDFHVLLIKVYTYIDNRF